MRIRNWPRGRWESGEVNGMKNNQRPAVLKQVAGSQLGVTRSNVAGIDIGSSEMFVCGPEQPDGTRELRAFATTTQQIHSCVDWLRQQNVKSAAMESTGVYWIPGLRSWKAAGSKRCWWTRGRSRGCPAAKRMSRTRSGYRRCTATVCCRAAIV